MTDNVFPAYVPELDQDILLRLDDRDLLRSCATNSYVASICDDDVDRGPALLENYCKSQ